MDTNLPISQLDPIGSNNFTGVGDLFEAWLGPMPVMSRTDQYQHRNVQTWDMSEAYKGKNLYLRDTAEDAAFTANQTHLTQRIMPLFATDDINMQWEHFEARAHLMDLTPYQTTSHAVTQRRMIRRAQLKRHGIMAEFENDFLRTAMGRARFLAALGQISRSIIETMNAEVIRTLGAGHRYQQQFVREGGMPQDQQLKYFLEQDRRRFAIAQKTKNGLEKLNSEINKEMSAYGGQADCFLIPEEISIFTKVARSEKTDYYLAGPMGPARINNTPGTAGPLAAGGTQGSLDRVEPRHMVQDVPVYIVKNLQVENVTEAESQMLTRSRQIGEYVTMIDDCQDYSMYTSEHRSILMYNQDIDDMTKITLEVAIQNSAIFDDDEVKPMNYQKSVTSIQRQDQDEDFLTFLRTEANGQTRRDTVEYLFDIAPEYLSSKKVVGGGQTLLNAFRKQMPKFDANAFDRDQYYTDAANGVIQAFADLSRKKRNLFNKAANALNSIIGTNSAISPGVPLTGAVLYEKLVLPETVPVQNKEPAVLVESNAQVDDAFFQTLMSQVPESKKTEVQSAVAAHVGNTVAKGEVIRNKILQFVGENVPGLKFKDEAPVHKWFSDRVNQYKELSASAQPAAASAGARGHMEPGLDLTGTGYSYVYEASQRPNANALERLSGFRAVFDAEEDARRGTSAPQDSSLHQSGLGFAGIGQFARDPVARRTDRIANTRDRVGHLLAHVAALDSSGASPIVKAFGIVFLMTRLTRQNMLSFCNNDVMVPINFLLFRPHMQYRTRGIIKCMRDGGTGITAFGHSNLGITSEPGGRKVSKMHYTMHFRVVVVYPKNLYVQPDVYVQEAEGGAGCRFHSPETYAQLDLDHLEASLICVAVPVTETNFPSPLDISGRFYTEFTMGVSARSQYENLHYSSAARYNAMYNFLETARNGAEVPHISLERTHRNRICYQGHQQNHNPKSGNYDRITVNKGHWTKNVGPGNGGVRNGALEEMDVIDYSTKNAN